MRNMGKQARFSFGSCRRWALGIAPEEATFARRGFRQHNAAARQRLEHIGEVFLYGYHGALERETADALAAHLNQAEAEFRGFAFEGAGMAIALLDGLAPWREGRLRAFLGDAGAAHTYMVHVGAGWAMARLRWRAGAIISQLDHLLRWLAIDGYGFHEGYFRWPYYEKHRALPGWLSSYGKRVFDQGLGRSLWFVTGANGVRVAALINAFPQARRADLWSGTGLACAYAGGAGETELKALRQSAEPYTPPLAQGAAFAAKARQRANNPAPHTEMACEALCGLSADEAAWLTDVALQDLPPDGETPAYAVWRDRIQSAFASSEVNR